MVDLRGLQLHLGIAVAQHEAQHAVGLAARLAEHGAVGLAQEFVPALLVFVDRGAQFALGHLELFGGGVPRVPVGAVLRGSEQGVVEGILGGDHGGTLMVVVNMRTSVQ